jgi:16S rRNA (cytidine1402-2'-O)-methyltransferase
MPGTLYVVATPIGNLEDITLRAIRTLKEVDVIAAEDTRHTLKLLNHFDIRRPLVSLREHNEAREGAKLVDRMRRGESVALVSDAGTPAIADPGARLVASARQAGLTVTPVPGPSAVTAALSISGYQGTEWVFMGFPPAAGKARAGWFARLAAESRAVVLFESPHRINRTLSELVRELVGRQILVHRELTKIHEMSVELPIEASTPSRGEYALVIMPSQVRAQTIDASQVDSLVDRLVNGTPMGDAEARSIAAAVFSVSESEIRKLLKSHKYSVLRHNQ